MCVTISMCCMLLCRSLFDVAGVCYSCSVECTYCAVSSSLLGCLLSCQCVLFINIHCYNAHVVLCSCVCVIGAVVSMLPVDISIVCVFPLSSLRYSCKSISVVELRASLFESNTSKIGRRVAVCTNPACNPCRTKTSAVMSLDSSCFGKIPSTL